MPSTSSKTWTNTTSSRQIHRGADREDKAAYVENHLLRKVSSKNKRKGPARKQAVDVGEDETASQDRIYFLGRLL